MAILIIIITLYLIFFFNKKIISNIINTQFLSINNRNQYFKDLYKIIIFIIIYIIFFRFVKLFLSVKILNLKLIYYFCYNYILYFFQTTNFILVLIISFLVIKLILLLRKLLIQKLKLSFIRLNYYYINNSEKYFYYYINIISWQSFFWYWVTITKLKLHKKKNGIFFLETNIKLLQNISFFFRYIGIIVIIISIIFDIIINNNNLIFLANVLPFFGFYQTLYIINYFFNNKLRPRFDNYCVQYIYGSLKKIDFKILIEISQYLESIIK